MLPLETSVPTSGDPPPSRRRTEMLNIRVSPVARAILDWMTSDEGLGISQTDALEMSLRVVARDLKYTIPKGLEAKPKS